MLSDSEEEYAYDSDEFTPRASDMLSRQNSTGVPVSLSPQFLDGPQLRATIGKRCEEISGLLGIDLDSAQCLYIKHDWRKDALFEAMFGSRETTLAAAGLRDPDEPLTRPEDTAGSTFPCPACLEDHPFSHARSTPHCLHYMCADCWRSSFNSKISERSVILEECWHPECKMMVGESVALSFLDSEENKNRYRGWVAKHFVESPWTTTIKWCPSSGCETAVLYPGALDAEGESLEITCGTCDLLWCFGCGEDAPHQPATCAQVVKWKTASSENDLSVIWIKANTKNCPKCDLQISKVDNTCQKVICDRCNHKFCWLCLRPYSEHSEATGGFYNCRKFEKRIEDSRASEAELQAVKAAQHLAQFHRAAERHLTHKAALGSAQVELMPLVQQQAEALVEAGVCSSPSYIFMEHGVLSILRARKVLMWSYIYQLYHFENDESPAAERNSLLLENYRSQLETLTEELTEKLEVGFVLDPSSGGSAAGAGAGAGAGVSSDPFDKWRDSIMRSFKALQRFTETIVTIDSAASEFGAIEWAERKDVDTILAALGAQADREIAVWCWQDAAGKWHDHDEELSGLIDTVFTSGKTEYEHTINGTPTRFDFSRMRQFAKDTSLKLKRDHRKVKAPWTCPSCTLNNAADLPNCAVCNTPKPAT